jgi:excinuclease ABC subunit C
MKIENFKKIKLPDKPGVYFFKQGKEILYIGKATSLKDRVKSYFSKDLIATRGPIILDMVFKADKIDWEATDSVLEALILEANLIKKCQPKYNTKEKDDKSFNYLCITKEKLPKIIIVRGRDLLQKLKNSSRFTLKGSDTNKNSLISSTNIFGPFPNNSQLKEALKIIRRIFPFLDDKSKNYLEFYRQINLVPDSADRKLYLQNIKNIKLFFEGKKKKILKNLEKEMKVYSKTREFEKAGEIKRQIFALQHINDIALLKEDRFASRNFSQVLGSPGPYPGQTIRKTSPDSAFRLEAYDIAHMGGKNMVGVMVVVEDGEVNKNEYKKFKIRTQNDANDTGALKEVLERRLAHVEWAYPNLIVVDGSTAQINFTRKALVKVGANIPIVSVIKDERHKPKGIGGDKKLGMKYEKEILLANSEAHRFAIAYHKNIRNKNFLK